MVKRIFKITVNTILVLLVVLGIFVIFSFVPIPGNYKIFTVQSGSMSPTIHTGSMVFVKPSGDYNVGDIVTRKSDNPKETVTHRIHSKEEKNGQIIFETKGDANEAQDMRDFAKADIIGKVFFTVPLIGYPVMYAKTTPGLILLIVIPAVIIIYDEINKIKAEIQKKLRYRKAVATRNGNKNSEEVINEINEESQPPKKMDL